MDKKSVEQILIEIDDFSQKKNLSKREMAQKLNISYNTFKKWFQKGKSKHNPSLKYIEKMEKFLESQSEIDNYWTELWMKILEWWKTQHRYFAISDLASDIGWDAQNLDKCFQNKEMPPKLVIEKIAKTIGFDISTLEFVPQEAERRANKVEYLLLFLEEELRWFRDSSEEARNILRRELDPDDIGYIASLLVMLGDEEKFRRWLALTTNRFNFFKKKGEHK